MNKSHLTDPRITIVTQKVLQAAKDTLGDKLEKVILFGSYARGDFEANSDIDFFVLADVPNEETNTWRNGIDALIPNIDLEHDLLVCIHVTSKFMFDRYFHVLPYYQNVVKDGVELYA
ncbi:MAG: nucleotidyltransferase domain-containing protein [Defluviitaleaceae bacterium]|nr:nucleotidyltransferase domain-containing protein [Defluviitaleaceae bacterium]